MDKGTKLIILQAVGHLQPPSERDLHVVAFGMPSDELKIILHVLQM